MKIVITLDDCKGRDAPQNYCSHVRDTKLLPNVWLLCFSFFFLYRFNLFSFTILKLTVTANSFVYIIQCTHSRPYPQNIFSIRELMVQRWRRTVFHVNCNSFPFNPTYVFEKCFALWVLNVDFLTLFGAKSWCTVGGFVVVLGFFLKLFWLQFVSFLFSFQSPVLFGNANVRRPYTDVNGQKLVNCICLCVNI